MQKILVIDDAPEIATTISAVITPLGIEVDSALNCTEGLKKVFQNNFDLVIIDIMLPDGDGFDLFSKIRLLPGNERIPVIFLTAKEDVGSKISAFSLGADDYIVKPFHLLELRARVESRLRKHQERNSDSEQVTAGPLVLEVGSQRIKTKDGKTFTSLTSREFKIFLLLAKHPDRIFSRELILNRIWGGDVFVTDRTVDAHICYLRKKLDQYSSFIESVPGEGYRFNPKGTLKYAV